MKQKVINTIDDLSYKYDIEKLLSWDGKKISFNWEMNKQRDNWRSISCQNKLTEQFMEQYIDKLDGKSITRFQNLSESFMEKYSDKIFWFVASSEQKLSEKLIHKYSHEVCWQAVSKYQKMSTGFIIEHITYIDIDALWINKKLNPQTKKELQKYDLLMVQKLRGDT